jgi:hypothetical protein
VFLVIDFLDDLKFDTNFIIYAIEIHQSIFTIGQSNGYLVYLSPFFNLSFESAFISVVRRSGLLKKVTL